MKQTIEIEVPDDKKAIWKDNKVVFEDIKSQFIESKLPRTWDEFSDTNPNNRYVITEYSEIRTVMYKHIFNRYYDKNLLPSEEAAKAHLALMQLHQLRDCYRQGQKPTVDKVSFGIRRRVNDTLYLDRNTYSSVFLSFQSSKIAEKFINNFYELIIEAGDLI